MLQGDNLGGCGGSCPVRVMRRASQLRHCFEGRGTVFAGPPSTHRGVARDGREGARSGSEAVDLDGVLAGGRLPVLGEEAHRHQLVANELLR